MIFATCRFIYTPLKFFIGLTDCKKNPAFVVFLLVKSYKNGKKYINKNKTFDLFFKSHLH